MERRCPFCLDGNVEPVGLISANVRRPAAFLLMECPDCERWYVADSGTEVASLCMTCTTPHADPARCYPEVQAVARSGGAGFSGRRKTEFNLLCSRCPHRHFVSAGHGIHLSV